MKDFLHMDRYGGAPVFDIGLHIFSNIFVARKLLRLGAQAVRPVSLNFA
jgi:hypothetical protein